MCTHMCVYMCVCIYIYRERERNIYVMFSRGSETTLVLYVGFIL